MSNKCTLFKPLRTREIRCRIAQEDDIDVRVKDVVSKMYLNFTSTFFELKTKSETSFKETYQTSFRVVLSESNPFTFVLQVHKGLSLPFAVQQPMERDLLALTARAFWATNMLSSANGLAPEEE